MDIVLQKLMSELDEDKDSVHSNRLKSPTQHTQRTEHFKSPKFTYAND